MRSGLKSGDEACKVGNHAHGSVMMRVGFDLGTDEAIRSNRRRTLHTRDSPPRCVHEHLSPLPLPPATVRVARTWQRTSICVPLSTCTCLPVAPLARRLPSVPPT